MTVLGEYPAQPAQRGRWMAIRHAIIGSLLLVASAFASAGELPFTILPISVGSDWSESSLYRVFRTEEDALAHLPRSSGCDDTCVRAMIEPVDFSRDMLGVIAPRGRGQKTYDVSLTAVRANQNTIDVSFLELRHGPSQSEVLCAVITVMPTPIALIVIPRSDLPVRFFRARADVICEKEVEVR